MSMPSSCPSLPPVKSDYVPTGVITNTSGFDVYSIVPDSFAEAKTKNAIIVCYDVHRFYENVKQFCDILGTQGFLVVLPDYFQGESWTNEEHKKDPQNPWQYVRDWLIKNASPEKVHELTTQVVEHLRKEYKVQNFGFVGFFGDFKECQGPIAFLPSRDESDLESEFVKNPILTSKPFASKIVHHRFDMHHGFAGAKADFKDPVNVEAVNEAISISVKFFSENLGVKY
ncbi:alpha/beta-hydrolase [Gigaspora margarita]|uniref:Alpha/beta-hydrolase n=1 Tax=Gigaspora margarita TaxID=4874 RepID=A0A8H3ZZU0_GIGMA|nr:alpha/beta-hydrolase [Gigaspora margarita]